MYMMFVPHSKHTYRPPRPTTGIALHFYVYMMFVPHRKHTNRPLQPVAGIAFNFLNDSCKALCYKSIVRIMLTFLKDFSQDSSVDIATSYRMGNHRNWFDSRVDNLPFSCSLHRLWVPARILKNFALFLVVKATGA
jgi:hypothetical protein